MKYRRLGSTELPVSVVGIGTWQFGGEWGRDYTVAEVRDILDRARELGINLLDTAECYGDHLSERLIGEAIEGRRDEWFIATKFGHRYLGDFERDQLWSADEVLRQLDASLEALRTDHVDLYQFHSGAREAFDDPNCGRRWPNKWRRAASATWASRSARTTTTYQPATRATSGPRRSRSSTTGWTARPNTTSSRPARSTTWACWPACRSPAAT
jgi:aryl-alcohol dehydrogenase-like predicted oxidoreductase